MEIINERNISIMPDKSIYRKMGRSSHGFNESIAEFIDNSIDAMTTNQKKGTETLTIDISLDFKKEIIIIKDDAKGMNELESGKSIMLAHSDKNKDNLGEYGFGLKTAALSIGKTFEITTSQNGAQIGCHLKYDEDEWENNDNYTFESYPIRTIKAEIVDHGTNILIKNLKIKLNQTKVDLLRKDIAKRYRGYIKGNVVISVNKLICHSEKINWSEGYPTEFKIETKYGVITGNIGLMKEGSQKGLYGFDLFRNNRMIRTYEKFGIPNHPTVARIIGDIHLNFVPVTHEKNKFIEDSEEYIDALNTCKNDKLFKDIVKEARKSVAEKEITPKIKENIEVFEEHITNALKEKDIEDLLNPNINKGKQNLDNTNISNLKKSDIGIVKIEKRDISINPKNQNHLDLEKRDRKPKKVHDIERSIKVNGKTFKYKHDWVNDSGLGRKTWNKDEKEGLIVFTNQSFPAISSTSDIPFYVTINIIESVAELIGVENNYDYNKIDDIKDKILKKVAEIKNQYSNDESIDSQKKDIDESNKRCIMCGKIINYKSPLAKYCKGCYDIKWEKYRKEYYSSPESKEKRKQYYKSDKFKIASKNRKLSKKEIDKAKENYVWQNFIEEVK